MNILAKSTRYKHPHYFKKQSETVSLSACSAADVSHWLVLRSWAGQCDRLDQ